ncbi:transposable element Tc1 transposase [Trichonephila clavipes]|nr:transposable element Tc1 transposase [Trichonephila clavipes]
MEFRHAIYRLHDEEHVSERKIAQMLGLSPSTVHYWITRRGEAATTKSGRPRVTDVNMDQNLYEASRKDPFSSAVDLQKELTPSCSVDTVRNRLKQKGLKCRTPAQAQLCEDNEENPNELIFMQDLSSIHTSKQTRKWLQERNVNVMHDWPPKGPDMNPVENVWAEMVRRLEIYRRHTGVRNRDQLWEDILHVFHEIPDEYFENLVCSMPRRVRTVASKHGGWTKY